MSKITHETVALGHAVVEDATEVPTELDMIACELEYLVDDLVTYCHTQADEMGWWPENKEERNKGELLALIHSEVSEALEGLRKDKQDEHLPEFKSVEVELADALIRIFDMAGAFEYRLGEALAAKLAYNRERADHKLENRMKDGGKKF